MTNVKHSRYEVIIPLQIVIFSKNSVFSYKQVSILGEKVKVINNNEHELFSNTLVFKIQVHNSSKPESFKNANKNILYKHL